VAQASACGVSAASDKNPQAEACATKTRATLFMFLGFQSNLKKRQLVSIWVRFDCNFLFRLQSSVAANVSDLDSVFRQESSDEQTAAAQLLCAGAADGLAQGGAVEIFAQVNQGQKRIEDAGFHFVGQMHAAGGRASQHFALLPDIADYFHLAGVRRFAIHGFAPHLRGLFFDFQCEMEHAKMYGFERIRHLSLASVFFARCTC
jgi:hypothetical protein